MLYLMTTWLYKENGTADGGGKTGDPPSHQCMCCYFYQFIDRRFHFVGDRTCRVECLGVIVITAGICIREW